MGGPGLRPRRHHRAADRPDRRDGAGGGGQRRLRQQDRGDRATRPSASSSCRRCVASTRRTSTSSGWPPTSCSTRSSRPTRCAPSCCCGCATPRERHFATKRATPRRRKPPEATRTLPRLSRRSGVVAALARAPRCAERAQVAPRHAQLDELTQQRQREADDVARVALDPLDVRSAQPVEGERPGHPQRLARGDVGRRPRRRRAWPKCTVVEAVAPSVPPVPPDLGGAGVDDPVAGVQDTGPAAHLAPAGPRPRRRRGLAVHLAVEVEHVSQPTTRASSIWSATSSALARASSRATSSAASSP